MTKICVTALLLVLAAAAQGASTPKKPTKRSYGLGYDSFKTSALNGLGGGVVIPTPFRDLTYNGFKVINLSGSLIPVLQPPSMPNCLVTAGGIVGQRAGTIIKAANVANFTAQSISFACAATILGEAVPISCGVLFEGTTNSLSGIPEIQTANYTGGPFVPVRLGFSNLRYLGVTVLRAGPNGTLTDGVSLFLDNNYYTVYYT